MHYLDCRDADLPGFIFLADHLCHVLIACRFSRIIACITVSSAVDVIDNFFAGITVRNISVTAAAAGCERKHQDHREAQ